MHTNLLSNPALITAAATTILAILVWYQARLLAKSERDKLTRDVADQIYGPLLTSLMQFDIVGEYFGIHKVPQRNDSADYWPWDTLKLLKPYLTLQVPKRLYMELNQFTVSYLHYLGVRGEGLGYLKQAVSEVFPGNPKNVDVRVFSGYHELLYTVDLVELMCRSMTLEQCLNQRSFDARNEKLQILLDGLESASLNIRQLDEELLKAKGIGILP